MNIRRMTKAQISCRNASNYTIREYHILRAEIKFKDVQAVNFELLFFQGCCIHKMMTSKECNSSKEFSPIRSKRPTSRGWPTFGRPHPRPRSHFRPLQPRPNWQKKAIKATRKKVISNEVFILQSPD